MEARGCEDATEARQHGSVTYRPTAEQAQTSPLCEALARTGATERDVIQVLFQTMQELKRDLAKALENQAPPVRVVAPQRCERCGYVPCGDPDPHGPDRS